MLAVNNNKMGANLIKTLNALYERLSSFPVQKKPIRFYSQRNFTATGEEKEMVIEAKSADDPFKIMLKKIIDKLAAVSDKDKNWQMEHFPEWDKVTLTNTNDIFILFASPVNGMLDFQNFCRCLDTLGHRGLREDREKLFIEADSNADGFINYHEFSVFLYSKPALRKVCKDVGQEILYVNSLSIGDQLYHGLY